MINQYSIKRLIAIVLIIAMVPKTGATLFLHSWLHASSSEKAAYPPDNTRLGYACTCLSDFLIPFTEADPLVLNPPQVIIPGLPVIDIVLTPSIEKFYRSLRAPPAQVA